MTILFNIEFLGRIFYIRRINRPCIVYQLLVYGVPGYNLTCLTPVELLIVPLNIILALRASLSSIHPSIGSPVCGVS